MSSYVAAFDGYTCCNCGLPAAGHVHVYGPGAEELQLVCYVPPASSEPAASPTARAAELATALLGLVERGGWAWEPQPHLVGERCRACGCGRGGSHHPACRYALLADEIARLC